MKFSRIPCQLGKQKALPFNKSTSIASKAFDLVHSDIWDPTLVPNKGDSRYFVVFINDSSHFTWLYLLKHSYDVPQLYHDFSAMVHDQFLKRIKTFQFDKCS